MDDKVLKFCIGLFGSLLISLTYYSIMITKMYKELKKDVEKLEKVKRDLDVEIHGLKYELELNDIINEKFLEDDEDLRHFLED